LLYDGEDRPHGIQHILLLALLKASMDRLRGRVEVLEAELVEEKATRVARDERLAHLEASMLLAREKKNKTDVTKLH
jgi:hypothetical protein